MELYIINNLKGKAKEDSNSIICSPNDTVEKLKSIIKNNFKLTISDDRLGMYYIENTNEHNNVEKKMYLNRNNKQLKDYNLSDKATIYLKDLGPQIGWRFTYVVEYLGPLVIMALLFFRLGFSNASSTQKMAFIMTSFHYIKRVLESLFVHEFTFSTMPLKNLFVNCIYYWGLYGTLCGISLFTENYKSPNWPFAMQVILVILFFCAEIKNLKCHLILRNLKQQNNGEKGIPHGEGFQYVSCANYFWEVLSWLFFSIYVHSIPSYLFTIVGFLTMRNWAIKRHREYKKTFADRYPKNRKAIIPFLI